MVFLDQPKDDNTLVNQISGFEGMITSRLHSCIVGYSLQIPTVAISWSSKVSDFMKLIGNKECAISIENLHSEYIVDVFEKELKNGYNQNIYNEMKLQVSNEISKIIGYIP